MTVTVDIFTTLALAAAALVMGRQFVTHIGFLARYGIPDAVIGGMLFAVIVTLLRVDAEVRLEFNPALLTPLNGMFFTTVGLSADARSLAQGGKSLLLFFGVVAGALVMQNLVGIGMARLFDLNPTNGLLAGSITLSGGHGTAAAWGTKFAEERNLQGAVELGIAAATYGLVVGGLLGGPLAGWLMRRYDLHGSGAVDTAPTNVVATAALPMSTLIETVRTGYLDHHGLREYRVSFSLCC